MENWHFSGLCLRALRRCFGTQPPRSGIGFSAASRGLPRPWQLQASRCMPGVAALYLIIGCLECCNVFFFGIYSGTCVPLNPQCLFVGFRVVHYRCLWLLAPDMSTLSLIFQYFVWYIIVFFKFFFPQECPCVETKGGPSAP